MCSKCYSHGCNSFDSEDLFTEFDKEFTLKLANERIIIPHKIGDTYEGVYFDTYLCKECNTVWCLSTPDNAWRGFFLPYNDCLKYIDSFKKSDRLKGIIGIALLSAIIIAVVYYFLTNF